VVAHSVTAKRADLTNPTGEGSGANATHAGHARHAAHRSDDFGERRWRRWLFAGGREWVCSRARGRVLEVAIGDGRNLSFYPADVELSGLDLDPAMLAKARERAAELGRAVDLHEDDAHVMPFEDGSFDTVVCTRALCGVADERIVLAEMARVLRPGGTLLLLDHVASAWLPVRVVQHAIDLIAQPVNGEHLAHRPLPLIEELGFEIVASQRRRAGIVERVQARKPASEHA
jgi:SAM-dependent methyltransferase